MALPFKGGWNGGSRAKEGGASLLASAHPDLKCDVGHNYPEQHGGSVSKDDRDLVLGQEMSNIPHISKTRKGCMWSPRSRSLNSNRTEISSPCFVFVLTAVGILC